MEGYARLRTEARAATEFEQVNRRERASARVVGDKSARVLVMLATTLLAAGGANASGGSWPG